VQSMTGFGRGTADARGRAVTAEVRAINHRYLDIAVRLPREHAALEEHVRAQVRSMLQRGRIEVAVSLPPPLEGHRLARIDTALAAQYHELLQAMAGHLRVPYEVDAHFFVGLPGVCEVTEAPLDPDADRPAIAAAVAGALAALTRMREREGECLAAALRACLTTIGACADRVAANLSPAAAAQEERLRARVARLLGGGLPAQDWPLDIAALLERADITEELVRLRSHLGQALACLEAAGPTGRRLDFLAQEMQREWTTISAKAVDPAVAGLAVSARVAVEQVREQVQNIQ